QMLPAAQRAEPADCNVVHRKVAAVALAEHSTLGVGRLELAPLGNSLAVWPDDPLGNIEAPPSALGEPHHDEYVVTLGCLAQPLRLGTVVGERVVKIARHETAHDRPGRRAKPDPERIPRDPGFRKRDQAGAGGAGLINQPNPFIDRRIEIEEGGGYLYRPNFSLGMSDGHCILLYAADRCSHARAQVTSRLASGATPIAWLRNP